MHLVLKRFSINFTTLDVYEVYEVKKLGTNCLVMRNHVIVKMADEREPPPFGEDENQKDDEDLFTEATEVWIRSIYLRLINFCSFVV